MEDDLLALLPDWRYCKIDYGCKGPRTTGWQKTPLTLEMVPNGMNIGVLTGSQSGGLLAVDFDGPYAWTYWTDNIKIDFNEINTVSWSSGRVARAQMAFTIPVELWPHMKTFKIVEPGVVGRKPDGIEFRWEGVQSVLPPSLHPDTHKPYEWIISPAEVYVQPAPIELLEWIISHIEPVKAPIKRVAPIDLTVDKVAELVKVMEDVKAAEPTLGYDAWRDTTFSCMTHVGVQQGAVVMAQFYPEGESGEYQKLAYHYSSERRPPGIGSLIERVRRHNPNYRKKQLAYVRTKAMADLKVKYLTRQLEELIKDDNEE